MKKMIIIGQLLMAVLFANCHHLDSNSKRKEESYIRRNYEEVSDTVIRILKSYLEYSKQSDEIVYQLFTVQYPDSVVSYLTYTQYRHNVMKWKASGYLKLGQNLVIIYSGLDYFFNDDKRFLNDLASELNRIGLKAQGNYPSLIEYSPWTITRYTENDSIQIRKHIKSPYYLIKAELDSL